MAREEFLPFQFENLVSPDDLVNGDINIQQSQAQISQIQNLSPRTKNINYANNYSIQENESPGPKDLDNKNNHLYNTGNNTLGNDMNNVMLSNNIFGGHAFISNSYNNIPNNIPNNNHYNPNVDNSNCSNSLVPNNDAFFNIQDVQFAAMQVPGNANGHAMADTFGISNHNTHENKNGLSISSSVQSDNSESVFSAPENPNSPDLDKSVVDSTSKKSSPSTTSTPSNTRKISKNPLDNNHPGKFKGGRTSHNMIEKKYRTNINSKILALRDAVPSLRVAASGGSDAVDLEGLTPATKLNKASVLTKAAEYIHHLEKKNKQLSQEVEHLKTICDNLANNNKINNNYSLNNSASISDIPNNNYANSMPNVIRVPYFGMSNSMNQGHMYQPTSSAPHSHVSAQETQQQFMFNNNNYIQQQVMPQPSPNIMQQTPLHTSIQNRPPQSNEMSMPMKFAMGGMIGLMGSNLLAGGGNSDNDLRGLSSVPFVGKLFSSLNANVELLIFLKSSILVYCLYVFCIYNNHWISTFFDFNNNKSNGLKACSLLTKLVFQRITFLNYFGPSGSIDDEEKVFSIIKRINSKFFSKDSPNKNNVLVLWDFYTTLSQYKDTKESILYKSLLQNMIYQSGILSRMLLEFTGTAGVICDGDIIQRLINTFYRNNISNSLTSYPYEDSYANIMNDAVIEGNLINVYRNFKANSIFRKCVELHIAAINTSMETPFYEKDVHGGKQLVLRKDQEALNKRLLEADQLAVDNSILKLTIRLFSSLLNKEKITQSTEFVKKALKQVYESDELNRNSMLHYSGNLFNYNAELKSWDEPELYQNYLKNKEHLSGSEEEEEYTYDDDSTYVDHNFSEDNERSTYVKTMEIHDSLGYKFINAELHITLICCLISKYLNEKNWDAAIQSLLNLCEYKDKYFIKARNEFTLLSFASIFNVLVEFEREVDQTIWEQSYGCAYESMVLCLRFWIGKPSEDSISSGFDCIDPKLKAAICDQLVELGTRCSGTEIVE